MKTSKFSILIGMLAFTFFACNDDSSTPSNPEHSGDIVNVELGYTDFVNSNTLKSSSEDYETVAHNYVTTGYTVIIKDSYNTETGAFENITFTDVDLANPMISFDAIEWFGIEVYHTDYVSSESGSKAYYSVDNPRINVTVGGPVEVPLELTQVSVHLANGTGNEFDSQIDSASINGINVLNFNVPVYVPADVDYTVNVVFNHDAGSDTATNKGTSGQAFYHVINDQSIEEGVIFELPTFDTPTDGGGIGL